MYIWRYGNIYKVKEKNKKGLPGVAILAVAILAKEKKRKDGERNEESARTYWARVWNCNL